MIVIVVFVDRRLKTQCEDKSTRQRAFQKAAADKLARSVADGPWFAHGITKTMLNQEWAMGIDEMIESEAQAQAICMQTADFTRAYDAFVARQKPVFEGN